VIPARKNAAFRWWFSRHARGRLRASFGAVRAEGVDLLKSALATGPALLISNHTSWWDPLVVLYLTEHVLRCDGHAMMDAVNLQRLPFFAMVGAFGVDLADASDGASAMRYAARLLNAPGRMVWVFPQGRERPVTERPLGFRPGSAEVARVAKCVTIPIGLRYEHRSGERPELWISIGGSMPWTKDVTAARAAHEAAVTARLDRIDAALRDGSTEGFAALEETPAGAGARLAERMLVALTRPWAVKALPPPGAR
jgi:1-acyl-sn-glycerol-3-phosphate acyltransferase